MKPLTKTNKIQYSSDDKLPPPFPIISPLSYLINILHDYNGSNIKYMQDVLNYRLFNKWEAA